MNIFRLRKQFRFEASHQLMRHDGKCSRLHGHSWIGYLVVEGNALQQSGPKKNMFMDYSEIGRICKFIEDQLDHRHLNDVLEDDMPTSELVAQWIYRTAKSELGPLCKVIIEETCTSRCEYEE